MIKIEKRIVNKADARCISSNIWNEKCEKETDKYIEEGLWVCFVANCIGHTRAQIFENSGVDYITNKYGEYWLQCAESELGTKYYRLR